METEKISAKRFPFEKLLAAAAALVTVGVCIPFLITCRYALPFADDFYFYCVARDAAGSSYFARVLNATAEIWRDFQGTYSSVFIYLLFHPLRTGSYLQLRLMLAALFTVTAAASGWFSVLLADYCGICKRYGAYFCALLIIPLLSYAWYSGAYLWYVGAFIYLLPFTFLLLGLCFMLTGRRTGKRIFYVFSGLFFVIMAGGVLECVGFGALLLLFFCALEYLRAGRLNRAFSALFIITLAFALLNALAPGNFVRHSTYAADLDLFGATINSFKYTAESFCSLLSGTSFAAFLLLAFLLGNFIRRRIPAPTMLLTIAVMLLLPVVTVFPVILGYGWTAGELSNRTLFLANLSLMGSILTIAILIGSQLSTCEKLPGRRVVCLSAGALALAITIVVGGVRASVPVQITGNLMNGSIQNYSCEWRRILDYIGEYGQGDVVVTIPAPEETLGCAVVGFTMNPDNWQNTSVAKYYNVDSVRLSN